MSEELFEIVQLLVDILIAEKKLSGEDKQIITTEVSNHIYGNIKTKFGEKFIAAVECFEIEKDFEELGDSWRKLIQLKRESEHDPLSLTRDDSPVNMNQIPLLLKDVISQQRLAQLRAFTEAVLHQRLTAQEQVSRLKAAVNRLVPLAPSPALLLNSSNLVLERPTQRLTAPAPTIAQPPQPAPSQLEVPKPTPVTTPSAPSGNVKQICDSLAWQQYHSVYLLDSPNLPGNSKIIGFDMDSTLIEPKSGRKFPTNEHDWRWLFPEVPLKLKELYNTGHKIVIFTNQNGISKGNQDVNHLKKKILAMINEIQVPMQVFMASTEDEYRKPSTAMWQLMLRAHNHGVQPDMAHCLYVGDAAGRPATATRSKDFSAGDRKFAFNLKIGFKTEREFFLNVPPEEFEWDSFDVTAMTAASSETQSQEKYTVEGQELVLMVGQPASGKSTFTKRHFANYARVNQDTLQTKAKCWQEARNQLSAGRSVVVDNTNPSREARKAYIDMAREFKVPVRCFVFKTDDKLAQHLNAFRERTQGVKKIPQIGYAMFRKQYEEPVLSEGFVEIKTIPFALKFDSPQEAELFKQFT